MSSATTVTGRCGTLSIDGTPVARLTQWTVNDNLDTSTEWGDSSTCGFTNRAPGRRGATIDCEGKYDTGGADALSLCDPGDVVALVCSSEGGPSYSFARAICTSFNVTVNPDTEEVIGWTGSFASDGEY
jgi:hypothetical protein